jgi:hypothetical protein
MKTVAYGSILWAFSFLIGKRYRAAAALLGLATTFHVLVGMYATLTASLFLLTHPRHRKAILKTLSISIPVYLVTGGFGLFAVFHTMLSMGEGDTYLDLIYIARNRHHLWPPAWWGDVHLYLPTWIDRIAWLAKATMSVVFLALIMMWCRFRPFREFAHLALLSSLFFVIGLLSYALGQFGLLKFYFFRFPDALIPFASFLLFFGVWERIASRTDVYRLSRRVRRSLSIGLHIVAGVVVVAGSFKTVTHLQIKWRADVPWPFTGLSPDEREVTRWIKNNTAAEDLFLADPYFEAFYVTAERGTLVQWKQVPSTFHELKEWRDRLVAVNGGREVLANDLTIDRKQIQNSFNEMPLDYALELAERYDLVHYYGPYREDWEISPLFRAGSKAVYKLP